MQWFSQWMRSSAIEHRAPAKMDEGGAEQLGIAQDCVGDLEVLGHVACSSARHRPLEPARSGVQDGLAQRPFALQPGTRAHRGPRRSHRRDLGPVVVRAAASAQERSSAPAEAHPWVPGRPRTQQGKAEQQAPAAVLSLEGGAHLEGSTTFSIDGHAPATRPRAQALIGLQAIPASGRRASGAWRWRRRARRTPAVLSQRLLTSTGTVQASAASRGSRHATSIMRDRQLLLRHPRRTLGPALVAGSRANLPVRQHTEFGPVPRFRSRRRDLRRGEPPSPARSAPSSVSSRCRHHRSIGLRAAKAIPQSIASPWSLRRG